jgi:hypothetical protein
MNKHLMVDCETLADGSRADVPVLQVGGAVFSIENGQAIIHEKWSVNFGFDLATQDVVSPPVCKKTMDWWQQRPEDVRKEVFFPVHSLSDNVRPWYDLDDRSTAKGLTQAVWDECKSFGPDAAPFATIWADVDDFTWLTSLFNRYNMVPPWAYNAKRDYRTVRQMAVARNGGPFEPHPQVGASHNGADDAVWQCHMLAKYLKVLGVEL